MTTTIIIISIITWYVCGVLSFVYWWTKDFNFKTDDLYFSLLIGFIGPIGFPIGWAIHRDKKDDKVLIKKRD